MLKFAPNLYFMYREHAHLDRFAAARADGFRYVETCYFDDLDIGDIKRALDDAGQTLLSFNFPPGDVQPGVTRGLAAIPGREAEFRDLVRQGLEWAAFLGVKQALCPHYGLRPEGLSQDECEATLIANLKSVEADLQSAGLTLLIEPHNAKDFPGYIISRMEEARRVVEGVGSPNLRILLDTYHTQRMEGDITGQIDRHLDLIAHIQVGSSPDRHEPDTGEVNHRHVFEMLDAAGYTGWVAGEYFAAGATSDGLGWITDWGLATEPS
jgi:hydroxypyruvate isomerase